MSSCNYVTKTWKRYAMILKMRCWSKSILFSSVIGKNWNLFFISFYGYLLSESNPEGHKVGLFKPVLKKENKQPTSKWKSNSNWSIQHRMGPDKSHCLSMKRPPQNPNRSYQS